MNSDWNNCETPGCERKARHKGGKSCTSCINKRARAKNPKLHKINNRLYYLDNKERIIKRQKEYKLLNDDKVKEYQRGYRERNREKLIQYLKEYRQRKKEER